MRQQALVPSGCQQWVHNPVAVSSTGEFAYSSALAVYIYGVNKGIVSLTSILARVSHSVTSISWNPSNPNLLAMSCADLSLKVFQLDSEREIASTQSKVSAKGSPPILHWSMHDPSVIFVYSGAGLLMWNYETGTSTVVRNKAGGEAITAFAQSRAEPAKIAVGFNDGLIWLYDVNTRKGIEIPGETRVTSLAFDPLSKDYLLAAMWSGYMKLLMTADGSIVPGTNYLKQPTGFRTICFMNTMPGTFLTVSDRSGVIQIWNVSKTEPMRRLKAGQAGLQSVTPIHGKGKVVLSVKDGTVMLYNIERSRVEWQTEGGHTETIFGCGFHPDNPNQLATCSYDSTIRLWDVTSNKATKALIGAQGVLYSVTWSPDGKFIGTSSSTGCTYIFSVEKGVLIQTNKHHAAACYRVEWHPKEQNLLASASTDKTVAVFRADGALTRSLKHPKGVCSVSWCPHERLMLASTCEDACVYIWDVSSQKGQLTNVLKGHSARVFNVAWNPILPDILLTGSDDTSARVWNVSTGSSIELKGHTSNVRGLLWHTEMPNVAITGSWDSTIMVWDTRQGSCLAVVKDHHADVYGIATHRLRPFTIATTSRDTTLRLWDLASTFPAVQLRAVCGEPLCSQPSKDTAPGVLCGTASAAAMASVQKLSGADAERFATLMGLLCPPGAPAELWDLALAAKTGTGGSVEFSTRDPQVPHKAAVRMVLNSKAQELEMRKSVKARGIGSAKREDVIREAAQAHLVAGNMEEYCRLSAEVGDWQEALAMAPAVGIDFWQGLMGQRAVQMIEEGATLTELKPYLLASGQAQELVSQLMEAQAYTEAFEIAAVASEGGYPGAGGASQGNGAIQRNHSLPAMQAKISALSVSDALPSAVRKLQAQVLLDNAKPVQAACCHMSVNDVEGALDKLQRGHEVVLAAALAMAMRSPSADVHVEALARQCELAGDYAMAGRVLQRIKNFAEATELLAIRVGSRGQADEILTQLRLGPASQYLQNALSTTEPGQQVRYLLLGGNYEGAADAAIANLSRLLASGPGTEPPEGLRRALMAIPAARLSSDRKQAILAYAFYFGAMKAIEKGYGSVVPFLVHLAKTMCQAAGGTVAFRPTDIDALVSNFKPKPGKEVRTTGSNIPSGGSKDHTRVSYISQSQIQGPYILLEDGSSKISLNEAVMLSHVMSFSPTASGAWLPV